MNIDNLLEKYKNELKEDLNIDIENLENSFNISISLSKWINRKIDFENYLQKLNKERSVKYRELFEYYKLEYTLNLSTKDEIKMFIESDKNFIDINEKYNIVKNIINYIDTVIEGLKIKSYEIKNYIEYKKFINGVV